MAKFCNQCGRPLQEGEVCSCQQQNYAAGAQQYNPNAGRKQGLGTGYPAASGMGQSQPPGYSASSRPGQPSQSINGGWQMSSGPGQPSQGTDHRPAPGMGVPAENNYQQPQPGMGVPAGNGYQQSQPGAGHQLPYGQRTNRIAAETKNLFAGILPVLKDSVGEADRISRCGSSMPGLEMVVANLVTTLLIMIIAMLYVNSKLGAVSSWIKLPYVQLTIGVVVMAAATYFSMAGLLYLCSKAVFGAPTDFSAIISLVGVKALLDAMVTVIAILFAMLVPVLGVILFLAGGLYTMLVCFFSYAQAVVLDGSKKVYSLLITYAVQFLMFYLVYTVILADLVTRLGSLF